MKEQDKEFWILMAFIIGPYFAIALIALGYQIGLILKERKNAKKVQ